MTNAPLFSLSPQALSEALALAKGEYAGKSLRLYIEGKGCDGFYYGVTFDDANDPEDQTFTFEGLTCVIDARTLLFCKGSVIEWIDDERGRGFLVDNPLQRQYRGKFYKKSAWQQKLEGLQDPS
jgi:iron-sulfur cluster assembly accessory protein